MPRNPALFAALLAGEIWLTHAIAFFVHEYAHSFTAWATGLKAHPLALHYGDLSFWNMLVMIKIDENVDYGPVFAHGQGHLAALIAAAGVLSGVVLYIVSLTVYRVGGANHPHTQLFFYLLCVMCAGNLIDYVPTRTFAPAGDMHTVEVGLKASPWVILLILGLPFLFALTNLFLKLLPAARRDLFAKDLGRQRVLVVLTSFMIFVFFGAAGLESSAGVISSRIALSFIFAIFPFSLWAAWPRTSGSNGF